MVNLNLESNVVTNTSYTASESINAFQAGVIWAAGVKSPNAFKDASYDGYSFITIKSDDTTYRRQRGIVINCCEPDSIVVTNALLLIIIIVTVQQCISWIVAEQWTADVVSRMRPVATLLRGVARGVATRRVPSSHAWPTRSWPHHRPCPRLQHNILFSHVSLQSGLFITRKVNSLNINFCKLHFNLIKYVLMCLIVIK